MILKKRPALFFMTLETSGLDNGRIVLGLSASACGEVNGGDAYQIFKIRFGNIIKKIIQAASVRDLQVVLELQGFKRMAISYAIQKWLPKAIF